MKINWIYFTISTLFCFTSSCSYNKLMKQYDLKTDQHGDLRLFSRGNKYEILLDNESNDDDVGSILINSKGYKNSIFAKFNNDSLQKIDVDATSDQQINVMDFAYIKNGKGRLIRGATFISIEPVKKGEHSELNRMYGK